jgi:ADP-ribose pyrophosphatase YjhB (NUDIX family)
MDYTRSVGELQIRVMTAAVLHCRSTLLERDKSDISMKFCSECAHPVIQKIPPDDNRPRYVCTHCGTIHYQNPKMVIGSVPLWRQDGEVKVLLCRRAIEPRYGYWTLPAGFMENNETTAGAAMRETEEEAGARIELHQLFSLLNVPHVHQVHMFYLATLLDLDYLPGVESLEVALFSESEIPWDEIAFPTITQTLRFLFEDLARIRNNEGEFRFHTLDITKPMRQPL